MKDSFKDKVLSLYRRTIRKHKWAKVPMMCLCVVLLFFDRLAVQLQSRVRKYVAVVITLMFAFISCSFSSVIWGDGSADFTSVVPAAYTETEESIATLAQEQEIDESMILEDDEDGVEVEGLGNDLEAGEDLSEVDIVTGSELLDNMDISEMTLEEVQVDETPVFSRNDWQLVLVNKNHPISSDYSFELGTISGSMQCDARVIPDLYMMIESALKDGVNLTVCSPYRNDDRQEMLFEKKVKKYTAQGMSYMDAYKLASQAVTIPGSSEHQIGLAFDMLCNGYSVLNEGFGDTVAGQWLAAHSYEYGFIIRYPAGKEDITGIEYEPWHLRYVGKNAAKIIFDEEITLEEFWEKYL